MECINCHCGLDEEKNSNIQHLGYGIMSQDDAERFQDRFENLQYFCSLKCLLTWIMPSVALRVGKNKVMALINTSYN